MNCPANIEGDEIVIRVPISTMQYAACGGMEQCCVEASHHAELVEALRGLCPDYIGEPSECEPIAVQKARAVLAKIGGDA